MDVPVLSPYEPSPRPDFIFLIGLNKCGTTSFHKMLRESGVPSLHWRLSPKRNLAKIMMTNLAQARRPFWDLEDHIAFSDISHVDETLYLDGVRFFREIHAAYPNGYFVLNTRGEDGWVRSRMQHQKGRIVDNIVAATGLSAEEIAEGWRHLFRKHQAECDAFFADNPKYLRFDIETDPISRFAELVAPHHAVDVTRWRQTNRGA